MEPLDKQAADLAALDIYRRVFNASPDYITIGHLETGLYIDVNPGYERFTGLKREQVIGRTSLDIGVWPSPADRKIFIDAFRRDGKLNEFPTRLRNHDGEIRDMEASASAVDFQGNQVLICVMRDVTERKRDEEELRQYREHLQHLVEQRTAELKSANLELDSFAYAVSHDLRAPLRAMSGFSQALIEDLGEKLSGDARVDLEQIKIASMRMGELIDGLLVLSRSTRTKMRHDRIDISAMAGAILTELAHTDPKRKIACEIESGMRARGDTRMIDTAMRNLLDNAWKFTQRTPQPSIRVYAEQKDGHRFFCVADNGAGFDKAHASKLFQPFQRLHRQEEFPGTGIGLATVARIVQRHGGVMKTEGIPGKGATFCFSLPTGDNTIEERS